MDMRDWNLHSALRTELVAEASTGGVTFKHMKLTHGKDDVRFSIHVRPEEWSTAGIQRTDLLALIGFHRARCPFFGLQCYARAANESFSVTDFAADFDRARNALLDSEHPLDKCGVSIPSPEGIGFSYGKPRTSSRERRTLWHTSGDGHNGANVQKIKRSEDKYFSFVLTFGEFRGTKGWVFHYKPKNPPLTPEMQAALDFIGNFNTFPECPEFDFECCSWRFLPHEEREDDFFNRFANFAHDAFDAHAEHFSVGLEKLLSAHSFLNRHNLSFLRLNSGVPAAQQGRVATSSQTTRGVTTMVNKADLFPEQFDVALSFAGTERVYAETLATIVRDAGYYVFYDNFYEEHLWGKDLYIFFDEIYRRKAHFCVMFISQEYRDRMWTTHERQSAQARALEEKGAEYILPIEVEQIELPGLRPTIKRIQLSPERSIKEIAQMLVRKLQAVSE
jgi:TIR domain-containing protein